MIGMRSRSDIVGHTPNAAVVLNFTPPRHGIPSLLSFTEIRTLFSKVRLYECRMLEMATNQKFYF